MTVSLGARRRISTTIARSISVSGSLPIAAMAKLGANGAGGQAGGAAGKGDDGVFAVSRPFDGADAGK